MITTRRSLLTILGVAVPCGFSAGGIASRSPVPVAPKLRFRSFEQSLRDSFGESSGDLEMTLGRRVEVGHSDLVQAGIQGCHNDRPFAGFPAGHLRIVRIGSEPGPVWQGVRLYVSTVDVILTRGQNLDGSSRPLDFASLPAAPVLC